MKTEHTQVMQLLLLQLSLFKRSESEVIPQRVETLMALENKPANANNGVKDSSKSTLTETFRINKTAINVSEPSGSHAKNGVEENVLERSVAV